MHFFVSSFNGKRRYAALIKNSYSFHLTKYSIGLTSPKAAASTPFYKFPRMIRLENLAFNEIQIGNIWKLIAGHWIIHDSKAVPCVYNIYHSVNNSILHSHFPSPTDFCKKLLPFHFWTINMESKVIKTNHFL